MLAVFRIAALCIGAAVYSDDPCRSDSPDPERRIAVIHTQSAAGPVTGGGVVGRLAGNFALFGFLREGLRGDGAQRQSRNQRVSHSANASTTWLAASTAVANRHIAAAT